MNTLRRFIAQFLFAEEKPLDVRTVNIVALLGSLWMLCILALRLVEFLFIGELHLLIVLAVALGVLVFVVAHYILHITNASAKARALFTIIIVDLTWPVSFFTAGGLDSGFAAVFVLTLALIFYLTSGKTLVIALTIHVAIIIGCYLTDYLLPDMVFQYSTFHLFIDTVVAVLISGCAIGVIDLFQNRLYRQEHQKVEQESAEATRFAGELEQVRDELLEQEQILSVVNQTTQMFLNPAVRNLDVTLKEALRRIGTALNIDRIRICSKEELDEGYEYHVHAYWARKDPGFDLSVFNGENYPQLSDWESSLLKNEVVNDRLLEQGINKSTLLIPVFQQDEYWGFVSFSDYHVERVFSDSLIDILGSASFMLVSALLLDQMDKQMQSALKSAIRASKAKTEFLSNMSHEIRTPMNAIIGMTSIARSTKELRQKDDALEKIDGASRHLLGVINDILDMSKLDAKKLDLSLTNFNFSDMLYRALAINEFSIESKHLACDFTVDERIPLALIGDDQRLSQVVTNLLSNAVKFTPDGGRISIAAKFIEGDGERCTVRTSIRDTGIGISEEQLPQLFASFQQAESGISRKYGGTGLGLAISKSIIELMEGRIWAESKLGEGSTFSFEISLSYGDETMWLLEEADGAQTDPALPLDFSRYEIMLAEDVEVNREIVAAFLEDTGITIAMAVNGREALELYEAEPSRYDLILMDVQMPEMDGLEATRRIRALKAPEARDVPIVAMTANVFKEDVESCLESGMNDHIGKPITVEGLKAALAKYLG